MKCDMQDEEVYDLHLHHDQCSPALRTLTYRLIRLHRYFLAKSYKILISTTKGYFENKVSNSAKKKN